MKSLELLVKSPVPVDIALNDAGWLSRLTTVGPEKAFVLPAEGWLDWKMNPEAASEDVTELEAGKADAKHVVIDVVEQMQLQECS